MHQDGK
jgi:mannose-6-phosphate isomerase-like protein (cupin superfamily)/ribosomal protein L40E